MYAEKTFRIRRPSQREDEQVRRFAAMATSSANRPPAHQLTGPKKLRQDLITPP